MCDLPTPEISSTGIVLSGEGVNVHNVLRNFFTTFYNKELEPNIIKIMANLLFSSASRQVHIYNQQEGPDPGAILKEKTFLEMIHLLLDIRDIVNRSSSIDLREYKMKLDFSYRSLDIKEDTATADVSVMRNWRYSFAPKSQSGAIDRFTVELNKESAGWRITGIDGLSTILDNPALMELGDKITKKQRMSFLKKFKPDTSMETIMSETQQAPQLMTAPTSEDPALYSPADAINYAIQYALQPNPEYTYFTGNDCANFTSQCLKAGNLKEDVGQPFTDTCWYYINIDNRSSSWAGTVEFRSYITGKTAKIVLQESLFAEVNGGDLFQLIKQDGKPYHNVFVSGVVTSGKVRTDLLACAHSHNRLNVSVKQYYGGIPKIFYHVVGNVNS